MELKIRGDKIKITDSMKEYIEEKLGKLNKYLEKNKDITAHVIVKVKGFEQTVEITIPLKSFILRSEETQEDFYAAVDRTIDKLERQVRKNKTRLMSKHEKASYDFNFDNIVVDKKADKEQHKVVKRKKIEIKPMSEEEAFLQMELLGHGFYVFVNAETDQVNVVYKRKGGTYGIIEPEE